MAIYTIWNNKAVDFAEADDDNKGRKTFAETRRYKGAYNGTAEDCIR